MKWLPMRFYLLLIAFCTFTSCSVSKKISKEAGMVLLHDTTISKGFVGMSVYDATAKKYLFNYNADKYFVPASNVKLFTLYAGMKYLGDSLTGIKYQLLHDTFFALPTADPTFLHEEFMSQKVADFLFTQKIPVVFSNDVWRSEKYGRGWAWDDYNDTYMPERSPFPVRGNLMKIIFSTTKTQQNHTAPGKVTEIAPMLNLAVNYNLWVNKNILIKRKYDANNLVVYYPDADTSVQKQLPFITNNILSALEILHAKNSFIDLKPAAFNTHEASFTTIYTQPVDSLFKPMMHRSDNFFAEQTLLMASNEFLGYMSDEAVIDTLLNKDLIDVPQKPKWVDGSGLSRYNLFTPKDFIYILSRLQNEFGIERLKNILPTGGEGTLQDYFRADAGFIFAKTGTLSNNCALSGYIITKKNKLLLFSIIANNYQTGAAPVRKAFEKFVQFLRQNF